MAEMKRTRPGVSPELLRALRAGKAALHQERERLSLPEKVRIVLELQRLYLPLLKRQRPLAEWEVPWEVTP